MAAADIAREHYRRVNRINERATLAALSWWRHVNPNDLDASWGGVAARVATVVTVGQLAAASTADSYVSTVAVAEGLPPAADGRVAPRALSGVASDGRSLSGLLQGSVVHTKGLIGSGWDAREAVRSGGAWLAGAVLTQIADAARAAESVATVARPVLGGYIRQINPGACSRCVVLAGRWYGWNEGFLRHPGCKCTHVPAREDVQGHRLTNPREHFDSLSREEQDRRFTKAGARAIRDGADISQVVNARRGALGLSTAQSQRRSLRRGRDGLFTTSEGASRRGLAGARLRGAPRLMPESIYEVAEGRAHAVELLRRNGYLI